MKGMDQRLRLSRNGEYILHVMCCDERLLDGNNVWLTRISKDVMSKTLPSYMIKIFENVMLDSQACKLLLKTSRRLACTKCLCVLGSHIFTFPSFGVGRLVSAI